MNTSLHDGLLYNRHNQTSVCPELTRPAAGQPSAVAVLMEQSACSLICFSVKTNNVCGGFFTSTSKSIFCLTVFGGDRYGLSIKVVEIPSGAGD